MWKKRKLIRKSLDELAQIMPVLSEDEQRECVGGYGSIVRGTGTAEDPIIIQEVFNVTAFSFGKDGDAYYNSISSAVEAFNNQCVYESEKGVHYKLEFVCNKIANADEYAEIHTWEDTLIVGSNRYKESVKPGAIGDPVLGEAGEASGAVGYYKTIEDLIGSGAVAQDAMGKVMIHEIGHIFGLDENEFPIMGGFDIKAGSSPGDIDSGAIKAMIRNNLNKLGK